MSFMSRFTFDLTVRCPQVHLGTVDLLAPPLVLMIHLYELHHMVIVPLAVVAVDPWS
jgi:hypothetical protein